jgi:hypothetical protein
MATSHYFNNYNSQAEQRLVEDLIVESIKIMGFDAYYLPNDNDAARDLLFGEDPIKKFQSAFPVEFYLSDALEYGGEKEFFSKFGLEIKNTVKVIVSKRSFAQRTPPSLARPREGDLIYVPFLNGAGELYEVTFADQDKDFHTLGRKVPYFYELHLEKFKFSNEVLDTGVEDIDVITSEDGYQIKFIVGAGTGVYQAGDVVFQSANTYANAICYATVQTWQPRSNTLIVSNINGEFTTNTNIKAVSSNGVYNLVSYNPYEDNQRDDSYDNYIIQQSANSIIDFSETNPFGSI